MSTTTLKLTSNNKKKTASTTKTTTAAAPAPAPVVVSELVPETVAVVEAPVKKAAAKKGKINVTTPAAEVIPVIEAAPQPVPEILAPVLDEDVKTEIKRRRVATKDTFLTSFDDLSELINNEIINNKDDKNVNGKYLKFLRNINKNMVTMKKDAQKLIKTRKKPETTGDDVTKDANKVSSGFLKPVPISHAMATFTGWSPTELKSRVDVTKFLCSYIKENNLQNPTDKRQIILDTKLSKLLDYKEGTLTYFDMQSHLKKHFPKAVTV